MKNKVKKNTKTKKVSSKIKASTIQDAVTKIKELAVERKRKFVESVDLAVNLGIDAKQSDQSVKGSILLPNGSGKAVKVVVFVFKQNHGSNTV